MRKLTALLVLSFAFNSTATDVYSEQFQSVKSVELVEVVTDSEGNETEKLISSQETPKFEDFFTKSRKSTVAGVIMTTKQLIALGKEIYKIVEAGKPVLTTQSEPIHILPKTHTGKTVQPLDLQDWRNPIGKKLRLKVKNYLGMTPAEMEFMLIFSYGGQYEGKGRYITGAQVKATHVELSWGYNLDAEFKVQSIMNQGTVENPVAGAMISIDYKLWTILKEMKQSRSFYINGLGGIKSY